MYGHRVNTARMLYIFYLFLLFGFGIEYSYAIEAGGHFLKPGSLGSAYLVGKNDATVTLKINFDASYVEPSIRDGEDGSLSFFERAKSAGFPDVLRGFSIYGKGDLLLFDESGALARIHKYKVQMNHWCENDGGIQYRPTIYLTVPLNDLKKLRRTKNRYDNFFSFAGIGKEADFKTLTRKYASRGSPDEERAIPNFSRRLVAEGKMSNGRVVARLVEETMDAGCTSPGRGEVDEDILLEHEIGTEQCTLGEWQCGWKHNRCCGP